MRVRSRVEGNGIASWLVGIVESFGGFSGVGNKMTFMLIYLGECTVWNGTG
jgi:hypothetical protein